MSTPKKDSAGRQETLLDPADIDAAINRLTGQIAAAMPKSQSVALVGLRSHGDQIARRIMDRLHAAGYSQLLHGALDITLYRDDLSKHAVQPTVRATEIEFDLDDACVILVDDVLNTGRTIRAAISALMDYGRPAVIRLAVLVDRGGRELPIAPDYVGQTLTLRLDEERRVYVELAETDGADRVFLQ